jgi:type IV secretory pathway VirJ component
MVAYLLLGTGYGTAATLSVQDGSLGRLEAIVPDGDPRGLVFLISDARGLSADLELAAQRLVRAGFIVAEVDLPAWTRRLRAVPGHCLYLVSDLEEASRQIQARAGKSSYMSPVLVGTGRGAAAAYAALAQAPAATIAGAISDGAVVPLDLDRPLCGGAPHVPTSGGEAYGPKHDLPGWWRIIPGPDQDRAADDFLEAAGRPGNAALVEPLPDESLPDRLARTLDLALNQNAAASPRLGKLPLVELPASGQGDLLAIVWSGDGGWRDLDKQIGEHLAASGVSVVGVDSLRYFWSARTPEELAHDLGAIIATYSTAWHRPKVILVGYSFGADILPMAYNRLQTAEKSRVVLLSLLALSPWIDLEIHVSGWLTSGPTADSLPMAPELARLGPVRLQCFYGEQETDSFCTRPELARGEIIRTAGGHHFDGNYNALADRILSAARSP